ncbi:MAG: UDP-N-acetylglucosamine--N-acetylmuramyl-(pentapeptide) pyrophosphoryl-undecaprenol N-acetylglucosamine transferase [Patescibacteria group bacterium]
MMDIRSTSRTIIFSGGGTGGSVTPLLAVAEELAREDENKDLNFVFVGTKSGPEQEMVSAFNRDIAPLRFIPLISGKWRRYFSIRNILDIFKVAAAWFKSFRILAELAPDLVVSAGAFVSVPLVWAAAFKKIPILIHQQDVRPGLANKLMAPFARTITVTFEKSLLDYGPRAVLAGNPVGRLKLDNDDASRRALKERYGLASNHPLVLVIGGGTGATAINKLIFSAAAELTKNCQVFHLTGKGKLPSAKINFARYQAYDFLPNEEVLALMSAADLVISRCGLATLSELATLQKAAILIPLPDSHQEDNAAVFIKAPAAVVLPQAGLAPDQLVAEVRGILDDRPVRATLENNIGKVMKRGAAETIAGIIWEIIK